MVMRRDFSGARSELGCGAFGGFVEPVAVAFYADDLGSVHEAVVEGEGAGRVRKDLVSLESRPKKPRALYAVA